MKKVSLSGSLRENVGKKDAAALRRQGKVPAVIYGGAEQVHFFVERNAANKLVFTPEVSIVEVEVAGKTYKAILKATQMHPVTDSVSHLDFLEIAEGKAIKIKLPVSVTGQARGVLNGGRLAQLFRKLQVVALESDLPDAVNIDVEPLKIGEKVRVADINIPGVTFLDAESSVVVAVRAARGATEEEEEEEAAALAAAAAEGAEGAEGAEAPADKKEG
ncbi:MAG: large subunit ribosomal protein L25 [Parvicellaceae bacterium]|jgi:large subunit ribosomal protein L25